MFVTLFYVICTHLSLSHTHTHTHTLTSSISREAWQNNLWTDMIDDEDADSDTDSRLSGSVIVDSVMLVKYINYTY